MKQIRQKFKPIFHEHDWKIWIKLGALLFMITLIGFDQAMKHLAYHKLQDGLIHPFLPGFINFQLTINYGTAFGLNQNRTTLIVTIAILISVILLIWWIFSASTVNIIGATFLLSGTIGNLIDRALHNGGVIDFLRWELFKQSIFNTADTMITIGIVIIIVGLLVREILAYREEKVANRLEQNQND